jgi:hypothetical protein
METDLGISVFSISTFAFRPLSFGFCSQPSTKLLPLPTFLRKLIMLMGTNQVVIENPVINSPFDEPKRHFRFSDEGITNEIIEGRRVSSYFIPIAAPKKKGKKQLYFDTEWTKDRIEENKFINQIRERILRWRVCRGDQHHLAAARILATRRPRPAAFLLPD